MPHFAGDLICAVLFAVAAVAAVFLLCPARVSITATLDFLKNICISIKLRLAFIGLKLELEMNILDEPTMTLFLKKKQAKKTLWSLGRRTRAIGKIDLPTEAIIKRLNIKAIRITGQFGVKDDAFITAIYTGLLTNALLAPLIILLSAPPNSKSEPPHVYIRPVFDENKLLLNLTGIASFIPIHIISAIVVWKLKSKLKSNSISGKESLWHIQ